MQSQCVSDAIAQVITKYDLVAIFRKQRMSQLAFNIEINNGFLDFLLRLNKIGFNFNQNASFLNRINRINQ